MAENEIQYLREHNRPRMNFHRSNAEPQLPLEAVSVLERYLQLATCMVPPHGEQDTHSPTLWHPDLHLDNIFVDPESRQITSIIDWQGATVMPMYLQCGIARAFESPYRVLNSWAVSDLPADYDSLDPVEKANIDLKRKTEMSHKYYEAKTKTINPRHWAALNLDQIELRKKPVHYAVGVWDDQQLYFLRRVLIRITENWDELCPGAAPCPVQFSKKELAMQATEDENMEGILGLFETFLDKWTLSPDGMVEPLEFDKVVSDSEEQRKKFIDLAKDEGERLLFERLWPYQDGDRHGDVPTGITNTDCRQNNL